MKLSALIPFLFASVAVVADDVNENIAPDNRPPRMTNCTVGIAYDNSKGIRYMYTMKVENGSRMYGGPLTPTNRVSWVKQKLESKLQDFDNVNKCM